MYEHEFAIEHIEKNLKESFPGLVNYPKCKLWGAGLNNKLVSLPAYSAARKYYTEKDKWRDEK